MLLAALLLSAIRYLDYVEFRALRRVFSSGRMRGQVRDEIYLRELEIAFAKVEKAEAAGNWCNRLAKTFASATVEMYLDGLYFDAILDENANERDWWMTVPVGERGYLRVSRSNLLLTDNRYAQSRSASAQSGQMETALGRLVREAGRFLAA